MERTLYIIRHGKSSWDHEGLDDIDRPLADRGIRNAEEMARRLMEKGLVPDMLFSSPANRAEHTARIMSHVWEKAPDALHIYDSLYMAYASEIRQVVGLANDEVHSLAIFGHNPSFTQFANFFLDHPLDNLPTAGVVVVGLECDHWKKLDRAMVKQCLVDFPKKRG